MGRMSSPAAVSAGAPCFLAWLLLGACTGGAGPPAPPAASPDLANRTPRNRPYGQWCRTHSESRMLTATAQCCTGRVGLFGRERAWSVAEQRLLRVALGG